MLPAAVAPVAEPLAPAVVPAPTPSWSLARRLSFRLAFAYVAWWLLPYPLGTLPFTDWATKPFDTAWNVATIWAGHVFLHRNVDVGPNGSGDTTGGWIQLALTVALALVTTLVWSIVDRRRPHYERLARWLHSYTRFAVGVIMIGYGLAKVFHSQFPYPSPSKLAQPYGDASPMGLLWTFMGFSAPYNVFTGLAETVPAVMLFFRRTATLGALLLVAVMLNVVMLNFCYDVPVKIFSTQLMLASLWIAAPRLRAIFDVVVLGRATPAAPVTPLFTRRRLDLAARIVGVVFGSYVLISQVVEFVRRGDPVSNSKSVPSALTASWLVDSELVDGKPVAADSPTRWLKLGLYVYKTDVRVDYHQLDGFYDRFFFKHDAGKKTLTLDGDPGQAPATWTYVQPDADHLTVTIAGGAKPRTLALHRDTTKHEWRLATRGFHWVNESPYNR